MAHPGSPLESPLQMWSKDHVTYSPNLLDLVWLWSAQIYQELLLNVRYFEF